MDNSWETVVVGAAATIAVFGAASLFYVAVKQRIRHGGLREELVIGIVFGLCAAFSMLIPLKLLPGMPVDGAPVAIALAAPFGGGLATAVAAMLAAALRLWLGGLAAPLAEMAEIVLAGLAGLLVNLIAEPLHAGRFRRVVALAAVLPSAGYVGLALRWPVVAGHDAGAVPIIEMTSFIVLGTVAFGALLLHQLAAEQKLVDSEGRFEALAANMPGVVFQCTMERSGAFVFSHLSGHLADFFGAKSREVEADAGGVLRLIHPEDLEGFGRSLREAGNDLALWSHDFRMIDPSGAERWVRGRARPQPLPDGNIVWHGAMVEVTRRKQREEARRRIERHYRLIAESTSDVIQIAASDGTRSYVSPSAARLFGYPMAELLGQPADAIVHPADVESVQAARRQTATGGKPVAVTYRLRRKDGSYVAVTETCRLANDADAERLGETISIIRAATAQSAGPADERPFARALEAMGVGVLITDPSAPDNPIVFANTAATAITGYDMADLIGRNVRIFQGPNTAAEAVDALDRAMAEERPAVVTWLSYRRDGTTFRSRLHLNPIHNARKQLQAFVTVFFDIGGVEASRVATPNLHAPDGNALSSFVAMLTQELRTPLTGVVGFSDLLLEGALAPEQRRYATCVRNAGRSIRAIVENAIDLTAIVDMPAAAESAFSIAELALGCSSVVWQTAREKKLDLNFVMKPDVIDAVRGHSDRIRHVLLDLLDNAVQATEKGGVTLTVARLADQEGKTVVRFSVTDSRGASDAAGDGLAAESGGVPAVCRALIERMGGTVGAAAAVGGHEFWLTLPLMPADGAIERPRARRRARILLAEDTAMSQELVLAVLTRAGHEVEVVGDGSAAVDAMKKRAFDLVLLDLQMPQMDGIKAAEAIRAMPGRAKEVPIIALTARASAKDAERCRAAGMDDHVAKPIGAAALVALVDHWLEMRPVRQDPLPRRVAVPALYVEKTEIDGEADDWQVGVMVENAKTAKTAAERAVAVIHRTERYAPSD